MISLLFISGIGLENKFGLLSSAFLFFRISALEEVKATVISQKI
jgi:hypothetical protein